MGSFNVATNPALFQLIGLYFVHWSSFELAIDIGIAKLTGLPPKESLRKTRGWSISRKTQHLNSLIEKSDHEHRQLIIDVLKKLPQESLRNLIAHCYMRFGDESVVFVQLKKNGKLRRRDLTLEEFKKHLADVSNLAHSLSEALGNSEEDAENQFRALLGG
jgi:hypothetical protein